MRKVVYSVACLLIWALWVTPQAFGQLITVGDTSGTSTSYNLPIRTAYDYSESQYVIPSGELNAAGIVATDTLYQIGWYLLSGTFNSSAVNINIYLHEVADPYPELCTAPEANGSLVYSGPLTSVTAPGCVSVGLDSPYVYGGGNLVVTICDTVPFWNGAPVWAQNPDTGNGAYTYQDNTAYDCDILTDSHLCTNTWPTTCFDITGLPTPTPTDTPIPTITPTSTPAPLGSECSNPILISQMSLPYSDTNSTCGMGFNYTTTCLGGYDGGEDIMYQLDLTSDTGIILTLDPDATAWTGIVIDDSCPPDYSSCIATYTNTAATQYSSECLDLSAGTYYIMIDTYPSPYCIPSFDLTVEECVFQTPTPSATPTETPTITPTLPPPVGDTCIDAITIDCGDCVTGSTLGATNAHDCGAGHPGGDVVYELILTEGASVTFIGEADFDADWTIATACDATTGDILCVDFTGTQTDPSCSTISHAYGGYMNFTQALPAGTYYIWVDGYFASSVGDYALEVLCVTGPTPTPGPGQDCSDPLYVNQSSFPFTETNTTCGSVDNYNATCLGNYDNGEDLLYQIDLTTDTSIEVTIDPNDTTYAGFVIDSNCPPDSSTCIAYYQNGSSHEPLTSDCLSLTAGTYYLMIDTWASPDCIPVFNLTVDECTVATATPDVTPTSGPTTTPEPIPTTGPIGMGLMLIIIGSLTVMTGLGGKR